MGKKKHGSQDERNALGLQVEGLLDSELKNTMSYHISRYVNAAKFHYGWDEEELLQELRLRLYRALPKWDSSRSSLTTYLSVVIKNYFKNFAKQCDTNKSRNKSEFHHSFNSKRNGDGESEYGALLHSDSWSGYIMSFKDVVSVLNATERSILKYHLSKRKITLKKMSHLIGVSEVELIRNIKTIKEKIREGI